MLNQRRWLFEDHKVRSSFPEFRPFLNQQKRSAGFLGRIQTPQGRTYQITITAHLDSYPATPPKIFLSPHPGGHQLADGSLCLHRQWRPSQDTLAQQILFTLRFLHEHNL